MSRKSLRNLILILFLTAVTVVPSFAIGPELDAGGVTASRDIPAIKVAKDSRAE